MIETALDYKTLYQESTLEIVSLRHEIANLKRMIFGSKSESFIPQNTPSTQLSLNIEAEAIATCSVTKAQKIEYTRQQLEIKKDHPGRTKLPEHLERREIIIEPLQKTEGCKKIGDEVTEELEYEPGKLFVNRYVRPKYVTGDNSAIIIAPMIDRPLPKAIVGPGLLAQIIIDKYVDHLPLYRQEQRFKREGVSIPYSTISDWIKNGCALLDPLGEALKKIVISSDYLHADETPLKVLDKNKKGTLIVDFIGCITTAWITLYGSITGKEEEDKGQKKYSKILVVIFKQTVTMCMIFLKKIRISPCFIAWLMRGVSFLKQRIIIRLLLNMRWSKSGCSMR